MLDGKRRQMRVGDLGAGGLALSQHPAEDSQCRSVGSAIPASGLASQLLTNASASSGSRGSVKTRGCDPIRTKASRVTRGNRTGCLALNAASSQVRASACLGLRES
jgi:hypothetical protein